MIIDNDKLFKIVKEESDFRRVCPVSIMALINIESSFDMHAIRTEKQNPWLYRCDYYARKNNITIHTEETLQHCSFGLMQIMGSTARSPLNFHGNLLRLTDPKLNIHYGVKYFAWLKRRYPIGTDDDIASAYNGGHPMRRKGVKGYLNQSYVDSWHRAKNKIFTNMGKNLNETQT